MAAIVKVLLVVFGGLLSFLFVRSRCKKTITAGEILKKKEETEKRIKVETDKVKKEVEKEIQQPHSAQNVEKLLQESRDEWEKEFGGRH